jgi:signal transduction histidine kinase/CheY-like chemotaxis protein/ABC-type amino acid transport substrate-binding protein
MFKKGKRLAALCTIIFVVLSMCMPCLADETQKTIRVGSFEDTFNYVDEHGVRRGYGYELMQALAGYTGWKFEYVKCDWSNCFDKLENGEIDIMGDIAYTDDRAKEMLFSEETMGEEKYVLYANLSDMDIVSSDFKSLDGKRIGVLKGTNSEYMLTNWENKYGIHTEHVNVSGNEDVKKKLANNEIDCFVSLEESIWSERGISSVTTIGESDIYFVINKERSDIKQELDYAMRQLDSDSPFFKADLYKKYFTLDYTQFLTGFEKSYIKEHGGIRIGFLDNDSVVFSMDKKSGEIRGTLSEYISYAKDCLGNHTLKFDIEAFDDYDKMIEALQNNEIDVIYYASRNSNVAEKKGYALSNTAWTYNLIAVTNKEDFNENDSYVVAVPKNKVALKQHIAYNYPHWKLVDCDSIEDGANMVDNGKVDCFIMGSSQVLSFDGKKNFKIIPLTKTMEACFAVKDGQAKLLSILNKTIKAMPSDMLTSAIAMYDSTAYKTTFYSFLKDHLVVVLVLGFSIIIVILLLLQKARRAEASAKVALKSAEDASLAKTQFLHNVSHDIRTPMNAILGYSELMKNELKDNDLPKVFEHLNKLQKAGNILLSIINNVLDMARIESGHMELDENYANIEDIRQRLIEMFEDEAKKKNIHVRYTFNVEHKHVMADVTKVEEIFVNILSNALKYTPSNGSVEVDVDELSCDEPGYMIVRTSIMDTGIGMSQEYLEKIFESFSRERMTSSKISGTGLGMAIVKKYVDLLGGTIDVKSVLGKGSTFIVTLKYKMADEKYYLNKQEENCEVDNTIFNGKHILLAEDNDLNAEIAQTILERAGLCVDRVKNGIECVNKVIENPVGTYDVILMDIQMPKMDGYKATCEIRNLQDKAKACIPIVAITANAFEEDKKKAIDVGMDGHIAKPINIEDLFVVLTDILNKQNS